MTVTHRLTRVELDSAGRLVETRSACGATNERTTTFDTWMTCDACRAAVARNGPPIVERVGVVAATSKPRRKRR